MKKILALTLALVCVLALTACGVQKENPAETKTPETKQDEPIKQEPQLERDPMVQENSFAEKNEFELRLFTDKLTYTTDEEIPLWATLEYVGEQDKITIWHGDPYITFSIKDYMTDGDAFRVDGLVLTILTSTELERGKVYEFEYLKSGGFSVDDTYADFWREFYQSKELKLPPGIYTVTVNGAFHITEQMNPGDEGPSASLEITVTE